MARILVIDDERDVRETLSQALALEGHDVSVAANGKEGLQRIQSERPDIVITDILMPEKEGIETMLEIRRNTPAVKVIAISGGGRMRNMTFLDMASRLGADAIMTKPLLLDELAATVAQFLPSARSA